MRTRARRRAARPSVGPAHARPGGRVPPRVELACGDPATRERLERLATVTGAFRVVDHRAERMAAGVDPGSEPPEVQVVALGSGAGDGDLVAQLRRQHRADPSRRTVVIGRGTVWFDAAFRAGIDAWVDDSADDGTLLAAIVGPAEPVGRSPAGRGPVGRGRAVSR